MPQCIEKCDVNHTNLSQNIAIRCHYYMISYIIILHTTWRTAIYIISCPWKHQISTLLALCEGNPLVTSGFPSQRASNVGSISMSWHHIPSIHPSISIFRWGCCPYPILWDWQCIGIIQGMHSANERWRYIVTSSLIGWAHTQNHPWCSMSILDKQKTRIINSSQCTYHPMRRFIIRCITTMDSKWPLSMFYAGTMLERQNHWLLQRHRGWTAENHRRQDSLCVWNKMQDSYILFISNWYVLFHVTDTVHNQ